MTPEPGKAVARYTRAVRDRLRAAAEGRDGLYLVEGRKAIADALTAGAPIREVWLAEDAPAEVRDELSTAAAERSVAFGSAPRKDLDKASETVTPQGALALVADTALPAADVLARAQGPILLLDRVQDPGNVGAVFRVAAGLGASGVLVSSDSADPLRPKALRASAGMALRVPFARAPLTTLVDAIRASDIPLWLLDAGGVDLWRTTERPQSLVVAIGSEGAGASPDVAGTADATVSIPMAAGVESLNAAVAAGIALAVIARLPVAASEAPTAPVTSPTVRTRRR